MMESHPLDLLPATFSYEPSWANKIYRLGKIELKAVHIPGHTLGNSAFLLNNTYLFSGDSIFLSLHCQTRLRGASTGVDPVTLPILKNITDAAR